MNDNLYDMIFKRKSFHLFRNIGNEHITEDELKEIENEFNNFKPLVEDIKVKMKIVKDSTTCKRGQEYCILLYSEKKKQISKINLHMTKAPSLRGSFCLYKGFLFTHLLRVES